MTVKLEDFTCRYCDSKIPFLFAAARHGVVLLFGHYDGFVGLVCPKCHKTNLNKSSREDTMSIRTAFDDIARTVGLIKDVPILRYFRVPHSIEEEHANIQDPHFYSLASPSTGLSPEISFDDHIDLLTMEEEHPSRSPEFYSTYLTGDAVLGPRVLLRWIKEDSIETVVEEENRTGVILLPRYVFYDDFTAFIENFIWDHHTNYDHVEWHRKRRAQVIVSNVYPSRIEHIKNQSFLDVLCGDLANLPIRRQWPTSMVDLMTKGRDTFFESGLYAQTHLRVKSTEENPTLKQVASELWEAFDKGRFKDPLSILSTGFILEYADMAKKTRFTKQAATQLRMKYLKKAYQSIKSSRKWETIRNQVPEAIKKRVEELETRYSSLKGIVSADPTINHLKIKLAQMAQLPDPKLDFLLIGETGTGKELFARFIHEASGRKDKPFEPVNCAAIPKELFESELFGAKKGGATDFKKDRKGAFDRADTGTIFLDEIGELDLELQRKLLRTVQQREIKPVGGVTNTVDIRIVFATNRNLEEMKNKGEFREDLYYRISGLRYEIPPLRQRKSDVSLLVEHFVESCDIERKSEPTLEPILFSEECLAVLMDYSWPGNVRELENEITKIVRERRGENRRGKIEVSELPAQILKGTEKTQGSVKEQQGIRTTRTQESINAQIKHLMEKLNNNKSAVGRELGLHYKTVLRRWKKISSQVPQQ